MEEILEKFGAVVCQRSGCNLDKLIYESDPMTKHKVQISNIFLGGNGYTLSTILNMTL